ncbi:MAG TPA: thioredoxin domain-containing protein [Candidatus Angelobacter sp.]|nr:thioredoxin domain-containing protein [Candidatus Angelobacter sp.]
MIRFSSQQETTADNIKQKLFDYSRTIKLLDAKLFNNCLDNEISLGLVFRDMNLASANDIQGTPTLFINTHRIAGVRDANQLRGLITQARQESAQTGALNAISHP